MKLDRKVAEKSVSSDGAMASVLMKLSLTPDQLGADIAFLSCFPGECEYLYGPGTYMEPKPERGGARMPGAVKMVEGQIHVKEHPLFSNVQQQQEMLDATTKSDGFAAAPPPGKAAKQKTSSTHVKEAKEAK